ncbi:MAG: acyl--CoA ligase, partial [Marinobacter sp.]|nr:acyl--CoA ligase [Marinobacter sp.]
MESGKTDMPVYAPIDPSESMDAIGHRIQQHARTRGSHLALIDEQGTLDWRSLVDQVNRIANRLREAGLQPGESVAALCGNSRDDVALYLGTLVAGGCMVPLSGMATTEALAMMVADCQARFLFVSGHQRELFGALRARLTDLPAERIISLAGAQEGAGYPLVDWLAQTTGTARPEPVTLDDPFNIIYSSGTTGTPKGILHDYRFRQRQMVRMSGYGLDGDAINLVSTPLYSNTTLVSVLPTLYHGGTLVLMAKFDAHRFLELAETHRVTHAMLVPVQYQRILAQPDFDRFDLSS